MCNESLSSLIKRATSKLYDLGFTESTVKDNYIKYWNIMLNDIGNILDVQENDFSKACLKHYGKDIIHTDHCLLTTYEKRIKAKSLELLYFKQTGDFHQKPTCQLRKPLSLLSYEALNEYLHYQKNVLGNRNTTLRGKKSRISSFLYLYPLETLTKENILEYIRSFKGKEKMGSRLQMNMIKHFLEYAKEKEYIENDYHNLFPTHPILSSTAITSTFTEEEIIKAMNYYHYSSHACSKRNYAIMMVLTYYGLRARDVILLENTNIDWNSHKLSIKTSKTGKYITFQLISSVGNAIIDYIINERPKSKSNRIFLLADGNDMNHACRITEIVNKAFSSCGVDTRNKHYGAHSLRSSLATRMMNDNIPLFTISKTLGHSSMNTTKIYTKVDIKHLRLCELEVIDYDL